MSIRSKNLAGWNQDDHTLTCLTGLGVVALALFAFLV